MSTANFRNMTDFPLIVAKDEYRKVCPECGLGNCADADKCEDCDCDLSEVESTFDDLAMEDLIVDMERAAKRMNEGQEFFTVTVESGYYTGVQFYVESKYDDLCRWSEYDLDYEFGKGRAEVFADYEAAKESVTDGLHKAKEELGLMELSCIGVFSNGEAVYKNVA